MTEGARKRLVTAAKVLVAVVTLGLVFWKVPIRDLAHLLGHLRARDLVVLAALTLAQVAIGVVRWKRVLARLGESVAYLPLFGDVLVGLTYNLLLPTGIGGDVVRAYRARARVSRGQHAWSSSIYERIAGMVTMATTGAIAAIFGLGTRASMPPAVRFIALGLAAVFLGGFFFASSPFRMLVRLVEKRLTVGLDELQGIVADLEGPLARAGARTETLAWSLLYQAFGVLFMIAGARALGAEGSDLAIAIGGPIVLVLSIAPVSIGGLGFREGLFVVVLSALGVREEIALGVAAEWLASSVLFALVGVVVLLVSPKSSAARVTPAASSPPGA